MAGFIQSECGGHCPDGVLLNGGFFQSPGFAEQVFQCFDEWLGRPVQRILPNRPQEAVAAGAVAYAYAKIADQSALIQTPAPHSLYLGLAVVEGEAPQAIGVLPRGLLQGQPYVLDQRFDLALDQEVRFPLFSSTLPMDEAGLQPIDDAWQALPPLRTNIHSMGLKNYQGEATWPVRLTAELNGLGVLEIQCRDVHQQSVAHLFFTDQAPLQDIDQSSLPSAWPEVVRSLDAVFGPSHLQRDDLSIGLLKKRLEQLLGPRSQWNLTVCRLLSDRLMVWQKNRRRSPKHELFWLNFASFGARPGVGVVGDEQRLEHFWSVFQAGPGQSQAQEVWDAYWLAIRRLAPGLQAHQQSALFDRHRKTLANIIKLSKQKPAAKTKSKVGGKSKPKAVQQYGADAALRCFSTFEYLSLEDRLWLSETFVNLLSQKSLYNGVSHDALAWCLSHLMAAKPNFADSTGFYPLSRHYLQAWLPLLLSLDWSKIPNVGLAAAAGVAPRADDVPLIDDSLKDEYLTMRNKILALLGKHKAPSTWLDLAEGRTSSELNATGEALPLGLRWSAP